MENTEPKDLDILTIGDPHIREKELIRSELMVKEIIDNTYNCKPDIIVILGDTLDKFYKVHTSALSLAVSLIEGLRQIAPVILLIGNHDYQNNKVCLNGTHAFTTFHSVPHVYVIDNIRILSTLDILPHLKHKELKFICVPYVAKNCLLPVLNSCNTETQKWYEMGDLVFAHSEIYNCKMGGITSNTTDVWDNLYPFAIIGHCHDRHMVDNNVLFTGSPIQHSYADTHNKTISVFTVIKNSVDDNSFDIDTTSNATYKFKDLTIYERRIWLNVPNHISETYSVYKLRENVDNLLGRTGIACCNHKITIEDIDFEIRQLKSTDIIRKLKTHGYIIKCKSFTSVCVSDVVPTYSNATVIRKNYKSMVREKIMYDLELLSMFEEIDGMV